MTICIDAYLVKMPASTRGIEHYAVVLRLTNGSGQWYRVFEKTTTGRRWYEIPYFEDAWVLERKVDYRELPYVLARLWSARSWTGYDPFLDNCEQFGRFVIEGKHYSKQVRAGVALLGGIALLVLLSEE